MDPSFYYLGGFINRGKGLRCFFKWYEVISIRVAFQHKLAPWSALRCQRRLLWGCEARQGTQPWEFRTELYPIPVSAGESAKYQRSEWRFLMVSGKIMERNAQCTAHFWNVPSLLECLERSEMVQLFIRAQVQGLLTVQESSETHGDTYSSATCIHMTSKWQ